MEDMVQKRKSRLSKILGAAHYALGGMAEDADAQMKEMDDHEDDFLSHEDMGSEVETESPESKRKARLFSMLGPQMKRKK